MQATSFIRWRCSSGHESLCLVTILPALSLILLVNITLEHCSLVMPADKSPELVAGPEFLSAELGQSASAPFLAAFLMGTFLVVFGGENSSSSSSSSSCHCQYTETFGLSGKGLIPDLELHQHLQPSFSSLCPRHLIQEAERPSFAGGSWVQQIWEASLRRIRCQKLMLFKISQESNCESQKTKKNGRDKPRRGDPPEDRSWLREEEKGRKRDQGRIFIPMGSKPRLRESLQ